MRIKPAKILSFAAFALFGATNANAQIAQNGVYKLEQAIVSSGGGTSSAASGSTYSLDGVIGEPVAGTTSGAGNYSLKGGFLNSSALAPTAAGVSITGRVLTPDGRGLRNASVTLTDQQGQSRTTMSSTFGYYRFDDAPAGSTYIVRVDSKRYAFAPQAIFIMQEIENLDFPAFAPVDER